MMHEAQPPKEDRSLGELLGELMQETTTLVRQELTLAKAELGQKASRVGKDVGFLVAGGAVAYAGLLAIVAAIIILLAQAGLEWWVSALLVGVFVAGIGLFLVLKGIAALKREDLAPRQTIESVKEDARWIRERAA